MITPDSVNEKPLNDPMEAAGQARREMVMAQRLINKTLNVPPISVPIMFFLPVRQVGKAHDSDSCIRWFESITGNME